MNGCAIIFLIATMIFCVGYAIGYQAFSKSPKRVSYSVLSGITAVIVTVGILFAGCMVLLSGTSFR